MFIAPTNLPEDPAILQAFLRAAPTEIERLHPLIVGMQRNRFGRRSEKQATRRDNMAAKTKPSSGEPPKRNRGALPAHLARVEVTI